MDQCDSERIARLEEYRALVDERFVARDKALDVATSHQKDVDEKLNDVRVRFVDKEAYKDDQQRIKDDIGTTRALVVTTLVAVILLLLGVVGDIATRL